MAVRAAVIGLKHQVAARRQGLGQPIEAGLIVPFRPVVRQDDQGQGVGVGLRRQGQQGRNLGAVGGVVAVLFLAGDPVGRHIGIVLAEREARAIAEIDQVVTARVLAAGHVDQHAVRIIGDRDDLDGAALGGVLGQVIKVGQPRVGDGVGRLLGGLGKSGQAAGRGIEDRLVLAGVALIERPRERTFQCAVG